MLKATLAFAPRAYRNIGTARPRLFQVRHSTITREELTTVLIEAEDVSSAYKKKLLDLFLDHQENTNARAADALQHRLEEDALKHRLEADALKHRLEEDTLKHRLEEDALKHRLETETRALNYRLEQSNLSLLEAEGKLHGRGLLETVETMEKRRLLPPPAESEGSRRMGLWNAALMDQSKLAECIKRKTGWGPKEAARKITYLYDTLSKNMHVATDPERWMIRKKFRFDPQNLKFISDLDCAVLECICETYNFPLEPIAKQQ